MKIVREHINEKFKEESDPISDMNIGLKSLWKEAVDDMRNTTRGELCAKYFAHYYTVDSLNGVTVLYDTLRAALYDKNIQKVFEKSCIQYDLKDNLIVKEKIADILKNVFSIEVNIKSNKSVLESFLEDSDPISDMGIGIAFGFSSDMEGLEKNDGKHTLYVNEGFIKRYCDGSKLGRFFYLKDNYHAIFSGGGLNFSCSFYFKKTTVTKGQTIKTLYYTAGGSGSTGFNGAEQDKKHYMRSPTIKKVLGQLYNHMLKLNKNIHRYNPKMASRSFN